MADGEFTLVRGCAAVDFALFFVGPDEGLDVGWVVEETGFEGRGGGDGGGGDVDGAAGVRVCGEGGHGDVLIGRGGGKDGVVTKVAKMLDMLRFGLSEKERNEV